MRIVSLLPSATEIVFALGLGDDLAGVTSSCDHPAAAVGKTVVSRAVIEDEGLTPAELDRVVSRYASEGLSVYGLDAEAIGRIDPDVILTQDLCRVCAVPSGQVDEALARLGCRADVVSLDPSSLDDVLDGIERVGRATGTTTRAAEVVAELRDRIATVTAATRGRHRVPTACLEWLDPPFTGGHWVPEMVERAGGVGLLSGRGERSRRATWEEVVASGPEIVVAMPCGYGLAQAAAEARALLDERSLSGVGLVAADADGLFSRPGPRLVDGLEALAWVLHPDAVPAPAPGAVAVLREPAPRGQRSG
jgi:iron complex transport system substrate-binding protein